MSAPYINYTEREPEGEHLGEDMSEQGPVTFVWCVECDHNTTHTEYCDEYGANRVLACMACRRIAIFY